jgi:hypothetical protein
METQDLKAKLIFIACTTTKVLERARHELKLFVQTVREDQGKRICQRWMWGGGDSHVDTGTTMANEGVISAHRVLPLRRELCRCNKVCNASPEISHSQGAGPLTERATSYTLWRWKAPHLRKGCLARAGRVPTTSRGG